MIEFVNEDDGVGYGGWCGPGFYFCDAEGQYYGPYETREQAEASLQRLTETRHER